MQSPEPMTASDRAMSEPPPAELLQSWRWWGRGAALVAAVTFAVGTLLLALDSLNVTTPEPIFTPDATLPDRLLTMFQNQAARFPWVFVASMLAAVSFVALAALGPVIVRFLGRRDDPRGLLLTGTFLLGGAVGLVAELTFIGGQTVASRTTYCDCAFADPQLISRGDVLDLVAAVQTWMLWGVLILFGIGLQAVASLARDAAVPRGWAAFSRWLGALLILVAVIQAGFPPIADALSLGVDPDLVVGVPTLIGLLVLVPLWALWLRRLLVE